MYSKHRLLISFSIRSTIWPGGRTNIYILRFVCVFPVAMSGDPTSLEQPSIRAVTAKKRSSRPCLGRERGFMSVMYAEYRVEDFWNFLLASARHDAVPWSVVISQQGTTQGNSATLRATLFFLGVGVQTVAASAPIAMQWRGMYKHTTLTKRPLWSKWTQAIGRSCGRSTTIHATSPCEDTQPNLGMCTHSHTAKIHRQSAGDHDSVGPPNPPGGAI